MVQVSPRKTAPKGHSNMNTSPQQSEKNMTSPLAETRAQSHASEGFSTLATPNRRICSDLVQRKTIRLLTPEGSPAGCLFGDGYNDAPGYLQDTISSAAKRSANIYDMTSTIRSARQRLARIDNDLKILREKRQQTRKLLEALGASINEIRLSEGEGSEAAAEEL